MQRESSINFSVLLGADVVIEREPVGHAHAHATWCDDGQPWYDHFENTGFPAALDSVGQVSVTTIANQYNPTAPVAVILVQPGTIDAQIILTLGSPY